MKKYTVTATIRWVGPPKGEPTELIHYRGDSLPQAMGVMARATGEMGTEPFIETMSIRLDVSEPQPDEVQVEHKQEADVRGCSCGMADYGAPGHEGHDEENQTCQHCGTGGYDADVDECGNCGAAL